MTYTILKGNHYSTNLLGQLFRGIFGWQRSPNLSVKVRFSKECLTQPEEADDISKLVGLGFGLDHHRNSIRIGWNSTGARINLWSYVYQDGKRLTPRLITTVEAEKEVELEITQYSDRYDIEAWKGIYYAILEVPTFPEQLLYKRLYPFFGGTYPAPVTLGIEVEWM